MTYMPKETGARLTKLVIGCMVCFLLLVIYIYVTAYQARSNQTDNLRTGCERSKLDRKDNADFQTAHREYIEKVVIAKSVEEDVKKAAREAVKTYNRTAPSLTKRSKIDCVEAFPKESIFSW